MSRRDLVVTSALVFVALTFYLPMQKGMANTNEVVRFYLTHAIVAHGTLSIDAEIKHFGDTYDKARVGDRTYCDKAPMLSLLAVPVYAPLHLLSGGRAPLYESIWVLRSALLGSAGVVLFWLLFAACRRALDDERWALALAVVGLFGTPLSTYFMVFFSHSLAATLLFGLFAGIVAVPHAPSARRLLGLGVLAGAGVLTEFTLAVPVAMLSLFLFWRLQPRWRLGLYLLGGGAMALGLGLYNNAVFGSPWSLSYDHIARADFAKEHARGLWGIVAPSPAALGGLLWSLRIGLVTLSPFVLLGLPGAVLALRQRRGDEIVAALVLLGHYLTVASFAFWNGGTAFGARHLVPTLPFALVLVARGLRWLLQRDPAAPPSAGLAPWRRAALGLWLTLAALSVCTFLVVNALNPYLGEHYKNPFANMVAVHLQLGFFPARALLSPLGASGGLCFGLWCVGVLGLLGWVLAHALDGRRRAPLAAAAVLAGVALQAPYYLPDAHDVTDLRMTYSLVDRMERTAASAARSQNLHRHYDKVLRLYTGQP